MKRFLTMKKWMAFSLALLIVLSFMPTDTFAVKSTDTGSITISGAEDGVTITAYQIMTVKVNDTTEQPNDPEYEWVSGVAAWVRTKYPAYIGSDNSVQDKFTSDGSVTEHITDAEVAAFYDALAAEIRKEGSSLTTGTTKSRKGDGVIEDLPMGNYLILVEGGMEIYKPAAANLVPTADESAWKVDAQPAKVEVNLKSSETAPDKKIVIDANTKTDKDNVNIGDTVKFELTAAIPVYPDNAIAHEFVMSDNLSTGLTFNDDIKVYGVKEGEDDVPLAKDTAYTQGTKRPTGATEPEKTVTFALTFDYSKIKTYDSIRVVYSAKLNKSAVVGADGNANKVILDYSNDPYKKDDYKTKDKEVKVYTYAIEVIKVDAKNENKKLQGAQFSIKLKDTNENITFTEEDGVYYKDNEGTGKTPTLVTNGEGQILVKGLDEGTYILTETKAPDGYLLPTSNTVEITIKDKDASDEIDGKIENAKGNSGNAAGTISQKVTNTTGFDLPQTGGIGTALFSMAGIILIGAGVLVVVAAIVIFVKRKQA